MHRSLRQAVVALVVLTMAAACSLPTSNGGGDTPAPRPSPIQTAPGSGPSAGGDPGAAETAVDRVFVRVDDVIDDAEVAALAGIPGVAAVSARREDDGALWSSRRADGTPVDDLPTDFKISVALEVDRPELPAHPGPGEVVLTGAGAAFRDLDVGAVVELTDRVERTVVAVVDDPLLDDVEFVVAEEDAASLDVRDRQRALLKLGDGAAADTVAAAAAQVLGPDAVVQARPAEERPLVLSLPETKARFGEFAFRDLPGRDIQQGVSWIREYITSEEVPILGDVTCNRLIFDDLRAALHDVIDSGLAGEIDPALYGGCWVPRRINKNANLSRHSWGIGIDINVDFSAPGLGPIPSEGVIAAFERHGFRWGGDYPIPDNHHFEWVGG